MFNFLNHLHIYSLHRQIWSIKMITCLTQFPYEEFYKLGQFPSLTWPHQSYVCHLSERLRDSQKWKLTRFQSLLFSWIMAREKNIGALLLVFLSFAICLCPAYEVVNSTEIKAETNSGLKNYQEEEDGKVLPYRSAEYWTNLRREIFNSLNNFRTFLNTVEIVVICVFTVVFVILMTLLTIYLCLYGCVLPKCCR